MDERIEVSPTMEMVDALSGASEMIITTILDGMKVKALVDTGFSLTIILKQIAVLLRNTVSRENISSVSITGHQLSVIGEVVATIRVGNTEIEE